MKLNREAHDQQNHAMVKEETTEPRGKHKSFIHQCFGHGHQGAIEGFKDCEDRLEQALACEMAERNAATEFEGAVETEKVVEVLQDDDDDGDDGDKPKEKFNPDSQEAGDEDEDHFGLPEFSEMGPEVRIGAKEVYRKLKATIKEIPRSFQERGNKVVETAVSNDDRPDSHLAAHDTTGIYKNKQGVSYGEQGARSSIQLIHAVGPPLEAITMPLPKEYPSDRGFRWPVVDDCWKLPNPAIACLPLNKTPFKGKAKIGPWELASRVLNKAIRHGGDGKICYQKGGWVDSQSVLTAVYAEISGNFGKTTAEKLATVHWLFALMFDTVEDPTVKSRYQLAGVVDNGGTLVQICYVRCKSGHNSTVASFIPDETIYTKIIEMHLKHISCICHKTRFEHLQSIFSIGLVPGGISTNDRAHSNFTPFPPFDNRNLAPGRLSGEYNVVIIFKPEEMIRYHLGLSMNAILVTNGVVPWTTIELVYVVPPINSGKPWVLYNPDLIDRKIMGHTSPNHGRNADAPLSEQDIPGNEGHVDCGWWKCPNCKAVNPKGFTACLSCRVLFTFEPIAEVSKVARRIVGKGGNAGSSPARSNPKVPTNVSIARAMGEAVKIARTQLRADKELEQRFARPGGHLWEVVNANMKWRIRFDEMTVDEQQAFIASGKSRFCAGEKFDKQYIDLSKRPRVKLRHGGAQEFLHSQ